MSGRFSRTAPGRKRENGESGVPHRVPQPTGSRCQREAVASRRSPPIGGLRRKATATGGNRLYTVQKGDTPGSIARKFYGSASKYPRIMEANHLTGNGNLQVGQKLVIPPAEP